MFKKAKWIWLSKNAQVNEYAEFFQKFHWSKGKALCRLSCDSDYTLFVNGKFVSSNQYGDFEHYKSVDEIDITPYLQEGENALGILVWHWGIHLSRYYLAQAGLIFEITQEHDCLTYSDENTLCRQSLAYKSGYEKTISPQLGFSFFYDSNLEDDWALTGKGCQKAQLIEKNCTFVCRPNRKLEILDRAKADILAQTGNYYLIDLKTETVGLAVLEFISDVKQTLRIDFGENLENGHVRRLIGNRDFSFEYVAKPGKNKYVNYMLRLGCRYLEIYAEEPIDLQYAGLMPQVYPTNRKEVTLSDPLDQKIYDMCVHTLQMCMMEHYVDCPWREQCLYAFDSRNQMLCGYYAFADGNYEYAKSNLKLFGEDRREDGFLSICSPCSVDLTIPSFSLYYLVAVNEYLMHTGDVAFAQSLLPKMQSIVQVFLRNQKNGLVYKFEGKSHWNFYDWSEHLEGKLHGEDTNEPDLMINCLLIFALENLRQICLKTGDLFSYEEVLAETRKATRNAFFCAEKGCFALSKNGTDYTELGNAFAILCGLTNKTESDAIAKCLVDGAFTTCSLSMKPWIYDALLQVDAAEYQDFILSEIRANYQKMLDEGATTAWETIDGASAFGNAGSLCHGWSAIPVYYYHKFFLSNLK